MSAMDKIKKGVKYLFNPDYRFIIDSGRGKYDMLSDEAYIMRKWKAFYSTTGGGTKRELSLDNPQSLCEKLQWLKLRYRRPELTQMVDKYQAKEIVKSKLGEKHIIPTLGVWDDADNIDFNVLPDKFILKCTHDSGSIIKCLDKSTFNIEAAKKSLNTMLKNDYYKQSREWPYKDVKHRIMAEPFVEGLGNLSSVEYKTTCMNGKVAFITICTGIAHDSFDKRWNDHFDSNFNKLNWYVNYKPAPRTPQKPKQWDELINFCEKLCGDFPYVRVDTYIIDGTIIFGEFTFFTWAGFMNFEPPEWDLRLGQMLKLPMD